MNLLILVAVLILAIASITIKKSVPAIIAFASMMFLLGIYYMLLDEKLLGLLQIFVYTGGIIVLMLFGLTLIGTEFPDDKQRPWAVVSTLIVAISLGYFVLTLPEVPVDTKVEDSAKFFIDNYIDFTIIFALVGTSLLYGTVKMAKMLTRSTKNV